MAGHIIVKEENQAWFLEGRRINYDMKLDTSRGQTSCGVDLGASDDLPAPIANCRNITSPPKDVPQASSSVLRLHVLCETHVGVAQNLR